ncbi:MAG: FAD-binding oxidoreductase, partial [Pseudomonadota bacterium]
MNRPDVLTTALQQSLQGRCDFSEAGIALYTSDASNYRQVPLGVVFPSSIDDIVVATRLCAEHRVPVLMRGAGTSQNGQCVNHAIIIDCSQHLNQVLKIDADNRTALIEPGVVCDALKAAAEAHGLTWGPDPATHSRCTLGGMIGNNSCGPRSMLAGKTVENVIELEVLTPTGERFWVGPTSEEELQEIITHNDERGRIYRELKSIRDQYASLIKEKYPGIKRRVSGYNLDQLLPENGFNVARALVGSEGTCVSILRARLQLIENPLYKTLFVLGFEDIFTAGDSVPDIMPFSPIAMEGLDWTIVGGLIERDLRLDDVALLPQGKAWLLVELAGSDKTQLDQKCAQFSSAMQSSALVSSVLQVDNKASEQRFWAIREQGASATSMSLNPQDSDPIVGWEDTAVDPMRLGDYLRDFSALVDKYGYRTSLYGHFGDGCIHARITFDTRTANGVRTFRAFSQDIARLVVHYGGSLSGEHGDGQAKAEFLPIMFGDELIQAFEKFKQ